MKYTKKNIIYATLISIITFAIILMFAFDKTKTWEIKFALWFAIALTCIIWLVVLLSYFVERKGLKEYEIGEYKFLPFDFDFYQDLRILLEEKEIDNTQEEKELLDQYKLKAHDMVKENCYYLVYKDNLACALIKYHKDIKKFEVLKTTVNLDQEIKEISKNK